MGLPPRLIDLSIARTARARRPDRGPLGTDRLHGARAVRRPRGERGPIGPAADAWGLGATLFHAVTGEKPFPAGSGDGGCRALPAARRGPAAAARPACPSAARDLIFDLLDPRSRAARPSCAEVVERLRAADRRAAAAR